MSEVPEEEITLGHLNEKIKDVLEINDVVQSDIAEIKELLKNLVELQLALKDMNKPLPPSDHDSMFN
jgi:hypothetical protein